MIDIFTSLYCPTLTMIFVHTSLSYPSPLSLAPTLQEFNLPTSIMKFCSNFPDAGLLDILMVWTKTLWIQCLLLCGKKIPYKEGIEVWTLICCNPSYLYACKRSWEGVNPVVECPSSGIVHVDIVGSVVDVCFLKHLPAAASGHSQSERTEMTPKKSLVLKCNISFALFPPPSPHSLMPRPLPEKWKEGLVFWTTFLVTWGGVERRKECNYCIPPCIACSM